MDVRDNRRTFNPIVSQSRSVGVNPPGLVSEPTVDVDPNGFPGTLLFAGNADNMIAALWQLGHDWIEGSSIIPHIHWSLPDGGDPTEVTWQYAYRLGGVGRMPTAWSDTITGTLAVNAGTGADGEHLTSFGEIDMSGYLISASIQWKMWRLGSADTNNNNARLKFIDLHNQKDYLGSLQQFRKV